VDVGRQAWGLEHRIERRVPQRSIRKKRKRKRMA
jgi:hypothetical protein